MPGTKAGSIKAQRTMLEQFGSREALRKWRRGIGSKGGKISHGGHFRDRTIGPDGLTNAQRAGAKGGAAPRRTKR